MRAQNPLLIRPSNAPDRTIDLTKAITAAVAHELWCQTGGNEVVNWIEAERFVRGLVERGARSLPGRDVHEDAEPKPARAAGSSRRSEGLVPAGIRHRVREEFSEGPIPLL